MQPQPPPEEIMRGPFPNWEFGNRKGKKQKVPVRLATNGHLNRKTASSYWPTMVAPRKLST